MKDRVIVAWIQGHIDSTRKSIDGLLVDLVKAHGLSDVEKELRAAVFALNRANCALEKVLA